MKIPRTLWVEEFHLRMAMKDHKRDLIPAQRVILKQAIRTDI